MAADEVRSAELSQMITANTYIASLVAQLVKTLPAVQETWVRSLGWEHPLEKGMAPTPVFWTGEFHELNSPWGNKELDTTERLSLHFTPQ